jgi:ribosomal protein S18 acetylase RimI-like enzyme
VRLSEVTRDGADIDVAAQIWAEATAARDGDQEVPGLSDSRPVIEAVLARSPESFVLLAYPDAAAAPGDGFAAVEPAGPGRALVSYLAVRPACWGNGVGEFLLRETATRLAAAGYRRAELSVYIDNSRAVELYERLGWRPCGSPAPHPRTGKPEQRYELEL